jgi:uncharacterized membrane protein
MQQVSGGFFVIPHVPISLPCTDCVKSLSGNEVSWMQLFLIIAVTLVVIYAVVKAHDMYKKSQKKK